MGHNDKTYIIMGATGGIGSVVTRLLSEQGASIIALARDEQKLDGLKAEYNATTVSLDATDPDAVYDTILDLSKDTEIHGIANLVGSILLKPAHLTKKDDLEDVIATNLYSAFGAVRGAAKAMMKTGGSVVLMSTVAASFGLPNHEAIAAAKAGVEGLARSAASSYANRGIRFNCVAPGLVETPLSERLTKSDAARKASEEMHPLGRIGSPEDIASMVVFLLDSDNSWITGQVFNVDGGMSSVKPK